MPEHGAGDSSFLYKPSSSSAHRRALSLGGIELPLADSKPDRLGVALLNRQRELRPDCALQSMLAHEIDSCCSATRLYLRIPV